METDRRFTGTYCLHRLDDGRGSLGDKYYPFKAEWKLYVPSALPISNCAFCIYGFYMSFDLNSDYFLEQR
jgi:hypothetical protein